ncbi:MAG TPA: aminotransferase class III-fold pyridoxal phosphate-dependent enzyme [Kofleriaceae bacterium]|nr:aminotransferase class III-fold pyridoxal phosphate-dependent enzyme [Kofleriaceae bacterium]
MDDYPFFFTWTAQSAAKPIEITGGDRAHFTTSDGARWLDLGALSYQVNAGHGRTRIVEAIKRQADQLCLSTPNAVFPAKRELAERLLAMAGPGFTKVFFTLGGAEANENALKIARHVTGRMKLISRYRSYHGASMGALSLTGDWRRSAMEPGIPGVIHVQDCYCDRCPFGQRVETCRRECATNIGATMALEGARSVAAVILEPVPGANGVLVPPAEYWPIVRQACDAEGALLIADEVLTGFGRLGTPFGHQHWGVTPDLITCAKGLTSGYQPLGAVIVHDRVARHFDDNILACGLTYYAHPTACAAAVETMKLYEDEQLYQNAARLGPILHRELTAIAARVAPRSFVRSLGLLGAIELEAPPAAWAALGAELAARKLSLHNDGKRGTCVFAPPLCITEDELVRGLRSFGDAAVTAFGAGGAATGTATGAHGGAA